VKKLFLIAFLAGCAGGKPEPQDSFDDLDGKADAFAGKIKVAGNLAYNDAALRVKYSSTPLYRGVSFNAQSGDAVELWVRSTQGDPVTWILRDYSYESHYFNVELKGKPSASSCAPALASGGSNATVDELGQIFEDNNAGWALQTRTLASCVDYKDGATLEKLRAMFQSGGFLDATPVLVKPVAGGGSQFAALLDRALASLHDRAGANSRADSLEGSLKSPVLAAPSAYLEVSLSTDAEECSQVGDALIDTRTGVVYLITQLLPC
jgi:hypothetical protein